MTNQKIVTVNPSTGETIGETNCSSIEDLQRIIKKFKAAKKQLSLKERQRKVLELAKAIDKAVPVLASTVSQETGRPITQSRQIISRIPERLIYLSQVSSEVLEDETFSTNNMSIIVKRIPVGIVGIITSWNYPIDIPLSSIIPAFLAGNRIIFKPSEYSTLSGKILFKLLKEYLGTEYIDVLYGDSSIGSELAKSEIDMISFTGKTETGLIIAENQPLKKKHLCLTGKDSMIILEDANLPEIVNNLIHGFTRNNGATCSTVQRVFIPDSIYKELISKLKTNIKRIKIGDASQEDTELGPICNENLLYELTEIINSAKIDCTVTQAHVEDHKGFFLPPTLIETDIQNEDFNNKDLFGPIVVLQKYSNIATVIDILERSPYGLSASLWTSDQEKAARLSKSIDVGNLGINSLARSNIRIPWTGHKLSGNGIIRSKLSILEFTNIKSITFNN